MQQPDRAALRVRVPLWLRLGLPIALIIALCIGFISFLNYFNYQKTYRQLNVSRVMVIGGDLRQGVEAGLNFGLAPKNNAQLDRALSVAKDSTEGLDFVVLTDEAGEWVAGAGNAPRVHDWRARLAGIGKEPFWQGGDQDTYQVGLPFATPSESPWGPSPGIQQERDRPRHRVHASYAAARLAQGDRAVQPCCPVRRYRWLTRRLESELAQVESALEQTPGEPSPALHLPLPGWKSK